MVRCHVMRREGAVQLVHTPVVAIYLRFGIFKIKCELLNEWVQNGGLALTSQWGELCLDPFLGYGTSHYLMACPN